MTHTPATSPYLMLPRRTLAQAVLDVRDARYRYACALAQCSDHAAPGADAILAHLAAINAGVRLASLETAQ